MTHDFNMPRAAIRDPCASSTNCAPFRRFVVRSCSTKVVHRLASDDYPFRKFLTAGRADRMRCLNSPDSSASQSKVPSCARSEQREFLWLKSSKTTPHGIEILARILCSAKRTVRPCHFHTNSGSGKRELNACSKHTSSELIKARRKFIE
jgi:hypothetical protein